MKMMLSVLCLSLVSLSAHAAVQSSQNEGDFGIVTGALYSKVNTVKSGGYSYNIIDADLDEPAANSHQLIVNVNGLTSDYETGTFNLGRNFARLKSVVKSGNGVLVTILVNDVSGDPANGGTYPQKQQKILLQFRPQQGDLSTKLVQ